MLEGIEKAIAVLQHEASRHEEELRVVQAEIERLVRLEESVLAALGTIAEAVGTLKEKDRGSVTEIRDAVLKLFAPDSYECKEPASSGNDEGSATEEEPGHEDATLDQSNVEKLSSRVSFDPQLKSASLTFWSKYIAERWSEWLREAYSSDIRTSIVERDRGSFVLTAEGMEQSAAVALSRVYLDIPPTVNGLDSEKGNVGEICAGDVVRNEAGYEFLVTNTSGEVIELRDPEKRKLRYPASALAVMRRYKAS